MRPNNLINNGSKILVFSHNSSLEMRLSNLLSKKRMWSIKTQNIKHVSELKGLARQWDLFLIDDSSSEQEDGIKILNTLLDEDKEINVIYISKNEISKQHLAKNLGALDCYQYPVDYEGLVKSIVSILNYIEIKRQNLTLSRMQKLNKLLTSAPDLANILNETCKIAVETFNADHSGFAYFDSDYKKGKTIAEFPTLPNFLGSEFPILGNKLEEDLVFRKKIIDIPNVKLNSDLGEIIKKLFFRLGLKSVLIVPVIVDGKVIASFSLDMIRERRKFSVNEKSLCVALAEQAAIAINNNMLYSRTQEQARTIETLYESSNRLFQARTTKGVVDELLRQVLRVVRPIEDTTESGNIIGYVELLEGDILTVVKTNPTKLINEFHKHGVTAVDIRGNEKIGISGRVALKGKKKFVKDVRSRDYPGRRIKFKKIRSQLSIPLKSGKQILGVITLEHSNSKVFSKARSTQIVEIVKNASRSLERAMLFERIDKADKKKEKALRLVQEIGQRIIKATTAEQILSEVVNATLELFEKIDNITSIAYVALVKDGLVQFDPKFQHGETYRYLMNAIGKDFDPKNNKFGKPGVVGRVISTKSTLRIDDSEKEPDFIAIVPFMRSQLSVPIVLNEKVHAIISVEHTKLDAFDLVDQEALEALAAIIALALYNVQRERERDRRLHWASHEMYTPIVGLRANTSIIQEKTAASDDKELKDYAIKTYRLVEKMEMQLTTNMTILGEGETQKPIYKIHSIYRPLVVACEMFYAEALHKGIGIRGPRLQSPVPIMHMSLNDMTMAFKNVISNAVKYSFFTTLHSEARFINVEGRWIKNESNRYEIQVSNYGVGITDEELEKELIFERGYRGIYSGDRSRTGGGLGLTYVKYVVVNLHGGKVKVTSIPLAGEAYLTTVIITLPVEAKND